MGNIYSGKVGSGLEVTEVDGSPDVTDVSKIIVSNGTLTDDGSGIVTITTSGSSGTVTSVDVSGGTTGLTTSGGAITTSGTITIAGTLIVANGGTGATSLTSDSVLTGTGTSAITAEGNLTFDGSTLIVTGSAQVTTDLEIDGALNHDGSTAGFYATTPVVQRTTGNASSALFAPGIPAGPLDQADTFGGYSLGQIVGALQDLGLLA